jgi:hypothetical protein
MNIPTLTFPLRKHHFDSKLLVIVCLLCITFTHLANAQAGIVPRKDNMLSRPAVEGIVIEYLPKNIPDAYDNTGGSLSPSIRISPNPASNKIIFEIRNMPFGNYVLRILNILGTEVWQQSIKINTNMNIEANISKLPKGTYLYNLKDSRGATVMTKKLIISRP